MEEYMKRKTECQVCYKIFKKPQILSCLHTLCQECVNKISSFGKITCPFCKERTSFLSIKPDFNTEELVEVRLKQDENDSVSENDEIESSQKQQYENYSLELEVIIGELKSTIESFKDRKSKYKEVKNETLDSAKDLREKYLAAVKDHFDNMEQQITKECEAAMKEDEQSQTKLEESLKSVEEELCKTKEEILCASSTAPASKETYKEFSKKLGEFWDMMPNNVEKLHIKIERNAKWTVSSAASLVVAKETDDLPVTGLTNKKFKLVQEIEISGGKPTSIRALRSNMWVCMNSYPEKNTVSVTDDSSASDEDSFNDIDSHISVHGMEMESLKAKYVLCENLRCGVYEAKDKMELGQIHDVVEYSHNVAYIAAENGLFSMNHTYNRDLYRDDNPINTDPHYSLKLLNGRVLATAKISTSRVAVICIYFPSSFYGRSLERMRIIYLPEACKPSHVCTIDATNDVIYVCNRDEHTLHLFTWDGDVISEYGSRAADEVGRLKVDFVTLFSKPRICAVDSESALIADEENSRLVIFDDQKIKNLNLPPASYTSALIVGDHSLYVTCSKVVHEDQEIPECGVRKSFLQLYRMS